jgi:DNA-binding transcriptional regulator YbjK
VLRLDSVNRRDIITDMAIRLIAEAGMAAVTYQALANRIGISTAGVQLWAGTRARLNVIIAATFYQRWGQWTRRRAYEQGALALLPSEQAEVPWTRVLLALEELARIEPEVAEVMAHVEIGERDLLQRIHPEVAPHDSDVLIALVQGLRAQVTRPVDPLPLDRARSLMAAAVARHAGAVGLWVSPSLRQ